MPESLSNISLRISRILHAGYIFEYGNSRIAFDPLFESPFSYNCYAYPSVAFDYEKIKGLSFDAVFISHYHDDHCSLESLNLLDRDTPIYLYCVFEELFSWIRALGFKNVYSLDLNIPEEIGPFKVTPRQALNVDVDSLFQIQVGGLNVLNVVDSWIGPATLNKLKQEAPWDLVLWPFQTMREIEVISPLRSPAATEEFSQEWKEQLLALSPRYLVPSSCQFIQEEWSWYRKAFFPMSYQGFKQQIDDLLPGTQVVRLDPSTSVLLSAQGMQNAPSLEWISTEDKVEVDYAYDPDITPPPTADIARKFPTLNTQDLEEVMDYCRRGLIEKYNSMLEEQDEYFHNSRVWKLSLYSSDGAATDFFYEISSQGIKRVTDHDEGSLSWLTEVPTYKVLQALRSGETLTSMYIRVNDQYFDAKTEKDLSEVSAVEDPLIRCLFNGVFCAYQKNQLRRLGLSE